MDPDPLADLAAQLRAKPPEGFTRLTAEQVRDLADAVRAARHRQAAELEAAGDAALRHVPRVLRVAIRKVVG